MEEASRMKNEKEECAIIVTGSSFTSTTGGKVKRTDLKAFPNHGGKRSTWVDSLHMDACAEFDRLRRLGVIFSLNTLQSNKFQLMN